MKAKVRIKEYNVICINCNKQTTVKDGCLWIDGWRCNKCSNLLEQQIIETMPQPLGVSVKESIKTKDKMGG